MEKIVVSTNNAPSAIGPYSQGVRIGNLVYTSGQIPINPQTGELVSNDVKSATRQSLENVKAVLQAAGSDMVNVIKSTVFLKDMNDFAAVNEVYAAYFSGIMPARSAVQVGKLPKDALVEIEVIAVIPE
jgi:2-iminobutanoate/2-iminopropanoate deaminase